MENPASSDYLDFFSNINHNLCKAGFVEPRAVTRFALSFSPSFDRRSVDLRAIEREIPEVFGLARSVLGQGPLFANLARYTLRGSLRETLYLTASLAPRIENAIKLFLNQSIYTQYGNRWDARGFYISFLLELLETLSDIQNDIIKEQGLLYTMSLPIEDPVESGTIKFMSHLKESLEFKHERANYMLLVSENNFLRKIFCILNNTFTMWQAAFGTIQANAKECAEQSFRHFAQPALDSLAIIEKKEFSQQGALRDWDQTLIQILSHFRTLNGELGVFHEAIFSMLRPQLITAEPPITESMVRRLERALIEKGVDHVRAAQAAKALTTYCHNWGIRVRDIERPEISNIDPCLSGDLLDYVKKADYDRSLNLKHEKVKEFVLERAKGLVLAMQKNMAIFIITFGLFSPLIQSCGIKTLPKSIVVDLKPEIPYKTPAKVPKDVNKASLEDKKVEQEHDN